jgi:hypothetical protein
VVITPDAGHRGTVGSRNFPASTHKQETTMFTPRSRQETHPWTPARRASARLGPLAAVLTALICGLLASAVTIPAAFAIVLPPGPRTNSPIAPATTRIITVGGMTGWQITLIALGAALVASAATFALGRARAARRAAPAPSA